jgi:hypothetical protein
MTRSLSTQTDRDAIERTITLYSHLVDFGRYDEWGELFTEDAEAATIGGVQVWGDGSPLPTPRGRQAIVDFVRGNMEAMRLQGVHLMHMPGKPVIEIDGDAARAWWTYIVVATSAEAINVAATGRYHAELVRGSDDCWRFRVRTCVETGGPLPDGVLREPPSR